MPALGFGSGLLQGLSKGLIYQKQQKRQKEDRQQDQALSAVKLLLDTGQVNDISDVEPLLGIAMPDVFGEATGKGPGAKKPGAGKTAGAQANPGTDFVRNVLQHHVQGGHPLIPGPAAAFQGQGDITNTAGDYGVGFQGPMQGETIQPPLDSSQFAMPQQAAQPIQAQHRTLFGVPLMSTEEAANRKLDIQSNATLRQIQLVRDRIYPALKAVDPTASLDDALAAVGIKTSKSQYAPSYSAVKGKDASGKEVSAVFDHRAGAFVDQMTRQPIPGFVQENLSGGYHYGVDRESIAQELFGGGFGQLTQPQQSIVMREEQNRAQDMSQARAQGTGIGKFNTPADLDTAQKTGVAVGTTAAQVAGQAVPTTQQKDRRQSITELRDTLTDIKTNLLTPLPKADDLGAYLPGAVMMARRRMPSYRESIAKLESAVNNTVNVIARQVGEQRGTQTENDALRAEAAIVSLRDSLVKGDTQESAGARIDETLKILDRIVAGLPATPTPKKDAAPTTPSPEKPNTAKPAGSSAQVPGAIVRDGVLYINGQPVQ